MSTVINVALPIFAIIFAGWLAGYVKLLGDTASEALNKFVYWCALPPVLFLSVARQPLEETFNGPFVAVFLGGLLIVFSLGTIIGFIVHRGRLPILAMQGLNSCFSNTGYMGIPLFITAFGPESLGPVILATIMMSGIMVGLAVVMLELSQSAGKGVLLALADVGKALLTNPLTMAPATGIIVSFIGIPIPMPVVNFGTILGAAAGPCALFAIGLFLAGRPLHADLGEVAWLTVLKLFWHPLIVWVLIEAFFPLDDFWKASALILAALPTGALTFIVATNYKVYVERTSATILISTIASVVTLSAVLAIYAPG